MHPHKGKLAAICIILVSPIASTDPPGQVPVPQVPTVEQCEQAMVAPAKDKALFWTGGTYFSAIAYGLLHDLWTYEDSFKHGKNWLDDDNPESPYMAGLSDGNWDEEEENEFFDNASAAFAQLTTGTAWLTIPPTYRTPSNSLWYRIELPALINGGNVDKIIALEAPVESDQLPYGPTSTLWPCSSPQATAPTAHILDRSLNSNTTTTGTASAEVTQSLVSKESKSWGKGSNITTTLILPTAGITHITWGSSIASGSSTTSSNNTITSSSVKVPTTLLTTVGPYTTTLGGRNVSVVPLGFIVFGEVLGAYYEILNQLGILFFVPPGREQTAGNPENTPTSMDKPTSTSDKTTSKSTSTSTSSSAACGVFLVGPPEASSDRFKGYPAFSRLTRTRQAPALTTSSQTPSLVPTTTSTPLANTVCTNADPCQLTTAPATVYGYTGFTYASSNGYWYSHDVDGLYISPQGYTHFANDIVTIKTLNKDGKTDYWISSSNNCCLPSSKSTNIQNVWGYGRTINKA